MGCTSVYTRGLQNVFEDPDGKKTKEAVTLCEEVLEPLLERSRLSISYGHISDALSRQIVKYQDPTKPSYHRWDHGAACDVILHDAKDAPIYDAFWIDSTLDVSRTITYSESPCICVATRHNEVCCGSPRKALYENRYMGERKPKFVRYSDAAGARLRQKQDHALEHDWRGAGYPTYHGGGTRQPHHRRTSQYTMLSDFLYTHDAVTEGLVNVPPQRAMAKFRHAGAVYDSILKSLSIRRMSVVRGYESPEWSDSRHNWADGVYFVVVPPASTPVDDVMDAFLAHDAVTDVRLGRSCNRIAVRLSLPSRR